MHVVFWGSPDFIFHCLIFSSIFFVLLQGLSSFLFPSLLFHSLFQLPSFHPWVLSSFGTTSWYPTSHNYFLFYSFCSLSCPFTLSSVLSAILLFLSFPVPLFCYFLVSSFHMAMCPIILPFDYLPHLVSFLPFVLCLFLVSSLFLCLPLMSYFIPASFLPPTCFFYVVSSLL